MKRARWHLALAAQALRQAPCENAIALWIRDCKDHPERPSRTSWCLRCRTLDRLERMGFTQPERPSDREFREAMERGEVFEVVDGGGAK